MNLAVVKLVPQYRPELLLRDLRQLDGAVRAPQPGTDHDGSWRGIALVQQGADADFAGTLRHGSKVLRPHPTALLDRTPTFREILHRLGTIHRARVLELPAGTVIEEHRDPAMSLHQRVCRIHVPIVTHPDVDFQVDGAPVRFGEGETWYADFTRPHSVHNRSPIDRVHLVVDVIVTERLLTLFPEAYLREARRQLGEYHVVPTIHARPVTPALVERFTVGFTLPEELSRLYEGRYARVAWDESAGAFRFFLDGTPGRSLYVVDDETLELEDGRLELHFRVEGTGVGGISLRHYRGREAYVVEPAERSPSSGRARIRIGARGVTLPVIDSSPYGVTFGGATLADIRVHDRVSVELEGPAGADTLRADGEVHWRDLTSPDGLFGVRYDARG